MISADELTAMRSTMTASLPDSARIISRILTSDGRGGSTVTWSAPVTVACRLGPAPVSPGERAEEGTERAVQDWSIVLPANTVVHPTDRITIGARTFEVMYINARRSWEIHTRVGCQEVQ